MVFQKGDQRSDTLLGTVSQNPCFLCYLCEIKPSSQKKTMKKKTRQIEKSVFLHPKRRFRKRWFRKIKMYTYYEILR